MNDFLLEYYSTITHCVEFLAALTGILLYKKYKFTIAKYFINFLVYLSIFDLCGGKYNEYILNNGFLSFLEDTVFMRNYWIYTLFFDLGATMFFVFYYNKILKKKEFKSIVKYIGYAFLIFSIIYIILNSEAFFINYFSAINIFGAVIVFLCTVFYFVEILLSDKILTFYRSINFYISVAIFIWWLITTPLVFYEIYHSNDDWNFIFLKWEIYLFANLFMYLTFTFALIWCKPQKD